MMSSQLLHQPIRLISRKLNRQLLPAVGKFTRESLHLLTHLAHVAAIKLENRQLIDNSNRADIDALVRGLAAVQKVFA